MREESGVSRGGQALLSSLLLFEAQVEASPEFQFSLELAESKCQISMFV